MCLKTLISIVVPCVVHPYMVYTLQLIMGCFRKLSCFNTCKRFHTQCTVYVLCVHVYTYNHACTCVHEQSVDHISLKRDKPTCYIVIHCAGCVLVNAYQVSSAVLGLTGRWRLLFLILGKRNVMHKYLSSSHRCFLCSQ